MIAAESRSDMYIMNILLSIPAKTHMNNIGHKTFCVLYASYHIVAASHHRKS